MKINRFHPAGPVLCFPSGISLSAFPSHAGVPSNAKSLLLPSRAPSPTKPPRSAVASEGPRAKLAGLFAFVEKPSKRPRFWQVSVGGPRDDAGRDGRDREGTGCSSRLGLRMHPIRAAFSSVSAHLPRTRRPSSICRVFNRCWPGTCRAKGLRTGACVATLLHLVQLLCSPSSPIPLHSSLPRQSRRICFFSTPIIMPQCRPRSMSRTRDI